MLTVYLPIVIKYIHQYKYTIDSWIFNLCKNQSLLMYIDMYMAHQSEQGNYELLYRERFNIVTIDVLACQSV